MGWKEPKYSFFSTRPKPCHGARYLSLGVTSDAKNRKVNATIFEGYLCDLQDTIANTWRITPEVVAHYQGIANFKATRHAMWIQARKDPDNQWLQLRYCIMEGDIQMAIKDWEDEWRIPVLTREIPAEIEEEEVRQEHTHAEEVGQEQTQPEEVTVPKKPRTGQNKPQQKKGGTSKTGVQTGKKNNTQVPQVQQKQV
jgi:hypothetical protein